MKKFAVVLLALALAARGSSVSSKSYDFAVKRCEKNDGLHHFFGWYCERLYRNGLLQ